MAPLELDLPRAEAFAEEMLAVLNGGALALMISLGHRAGLFDVMKTLPPADAPRIAAETGLHARYVREWLAAMVTGGVVEYDGDAGTYRLPPEHAAVLTRHASQRNLAAAAQWIPMLGAAEDRLLECFERGGGVPASGFGRLQAVMAEQREPRGEEPALRQVPGLRERLERGIDVLDVGCGSGGILHRLARAFPASRFRGVDVSPEAVGAARAGAAEAGLRNVAFELRDAAELREREAFDLVTAFDTLPLQAHPGPVLRSIRSALRTGGVLLVRELRATGRLERDADHPLAPFLYTLSCLHALSVSLAGDGAGLGAMAGPEATLRLLREAGFEKVETWPPPEGGVHLLHVAHRAV